LKDRAAGNFEHGGSRPKHTLLLEKYSTELEAPKAHACAKQTGLKLARVEPRET
jgi:hypothetical protein